MPPDFSERQSEKKQRVRLRSKISEHPRSLTSRAPHPLIAIALGIFGFLLWLHFRLFLQSNTINQDGYKSDADPNYSPVTSKRVGTAGSLHLKKLANDLTTSFSAKDGIASFDRQEFVISFQDEASKSSCSCDIISSDCLDVITCMEDMHNPRKRHALAWIGIEIRRAMKVTSEFQTDETNEETHKNLPVGKLLQYNTIRAWESWRTHNYITMYRREVTNIFVGAALYPECRLDHDNGKFHPLIYYNGPSCFYQSPKDPEESSGTIIEDEANRWYNATIKNGKDTKEQIRKTLEGFLQKHQPKNTTKSDSLDPVDANYDAHFSPLGNLILFAHMIRLKFNRRPFLDKIYQEQVTVVVMPDMDYPAGRNHQTKIEKDPFIISLHIRRGDSCDNPNPLDYEKSASLLHSKAQTGNNRLCYKTKIYLKAIARIRALVPRTRPIHVYLATDDVGNIMHEILSVRAKTRKSEDDDTSGISFDNVYGVEKWHFLNISRDNFNHKGDAIESDLNAENHPFLGESAVSDLWLLSHGHAFVGHLGSRFGKVAWLLATARRNSFVPFFSVDGHSFCCEIDENCGEVKPSITVDNCLTFGHEYNGVDHENYWEKGSVARAVFVKKHQEKKIRKKVNEMQKYFDPEYRKALIKRQNTVK